MTTRKPVLIASGLTFLTFLTSLACAHDFWAQTGEMPFPESELRNQFESRPDGSVGRFRSTQTIHEAIGAGALKRDYSAIRDLPGAHHFVFFTREVDVLREVRVFVAGLPSRARPRPQIAGGAK